MLTLSIRQILAHKVRFVMTSFAVVLGVSFVVGSLVVTDTVRESFETLFGEINQGIDLEVRAESAFTDGPGETSREPLPESLVPEVAAVDGVAVAEGQIAGFAQPVAPDGEPVSTIGAPMIGVSYGDADELYPVTLASGEKPTAPDEIVLDQSTFEEYGFELGQVVDVLLPGGSGRYEVVGTVRFGESNSLAGARLTGFRPDEAQRALDREGVFDVIDVAVEPDADLDRVQADIAAVLPSGTEVITGQAVAEEGSDATGEIADIFGNVLLGFAAIALFVSSFYIYNTFSIILGQRIRELALLRAVGATAGQIRRTVVLEALLVGLVSSVVGLGVGMLTALGLRGLLNAGGLGIPNDALVVRPATVVAAFVVGVGITVAASVMPARRAASVPPVAAMRDGVAATRGSGRARLVAGALMTVLGAIGVTFGLTAAEGVGPVLLGLGGGAVLVFLGIANLAPLFAAPVAGVLGAPVARFFGEPGVLARNNAIRQPYRTASTASALVIGLALVTMASVVGASLKESFADKVDSAVTADFILSEPSFNGVSPLLAEDIDARPEFDAVSGVRFGRFEFEGAAQDVVAVDPDGGELVDIDIAEGGSVADLGATGIFIHQDVAEDEGLGTGDEVSVLFSRTGEQTFTVTGVHRDATFAGNYLISTTAWDANFSDSLDSFVFVGTAEGVDPEDAAAAMEAATESFPQVDVEDRQGFLDSQQAQIDQILVTVNVLLLLAVTIAVLGIGNTLALSVFERTRELGLLRAVGMSRRQTRRMVRWEAAIVSLFGAVLGVAVGVVFGIAAALAMPESFLDRIVVPGVTLVGLLVLAVVAGLLAAIMPARRAARLDVLQAIYAQ